MDLLLLGRLKYVGEPVHTHIYIYIYLRILYTLGVFSLHVQSFCARSFRGFEGFDEDGKRRRLIGAVSMSCNLIRLLPSN